MKYFVYYDDDYPYNGGRGIEHCETSEKATTFIEERIAQDPAERKITDYTVIYGRELTIEPIKTAIKIRVNH